MEIILKHLPLAMPVWALLGYGSNTRRDNNGRMVPKAEEKIPLHEGGHNPNCLARLFADPIGCKVESYLFKNLI
jgi:hypothetical protein